MSASPLPAVPVASPAPAVRPSSPAPSPSSQDNGQDFNAHLQNAQQQSADAPQPASGNPSRSTPNGAASAKASSGTDTSQPDDGDDSSSVIPTSLGALASTVLNLIDQATGDTDSNKTGTAKSHGDKAQPPTTPPPPSAQHAVAIVAPPPVVPQALAAASGNGAAKTGVTALQAGTAKPAAQALQKASAKLGDDADNDDDSVGATDGNTTPAQPASDNTQALASALSAASHAVAGAVAAPPVASNASDSTPDLSALRGLVDATAVAAPPAATANTHALAVDTPVGSSGFAKELGQQVTWLSGQDIKQAQIRLNPQDLGPLDVKVSMEHGRVDVAFMAQHPATVQAVQQGLDQLHQMLGGQGLSLGHTTVGQHGGQQHFGGQQQPSSGQRETDDIVEPTATETLKTVAVGLLDAFA